jgi:hypothetical protein
MARFGDRGPYSPSNVYCTSFAGNAADVPPAVRKERRDRAAATARANANYSMPWLGIREGHPMARPVLTPLGRFGSAALAAEAHGIHSSSATLKARTGWKGWSYE